MRSRVPSSSSRRRSIRRAKYAFKHPLTQEVAYRSQLTERRARVHAAAARAIEELGQGKLGEQAALLAYHWEHAGDARARVVMKAGDVAAMPADIRHRGFSPKRSMLLVWENASPELPELYASGKMPPVPVQF
jgi:hypothetical protein